MVAALAARNKTAEAVTTNHLRDVGNHQPKARCAGVFRDAGARVTRLCTPIQLIRLESGQRMRWRPTRLPVILPLNHTSPPPLHSPENNHVASVPSHSNTRVPQAKAAMRIANSPGPIQPIVSVPWSMMLSMLLDPMGVLMTARGVGLGGTIRVPVGQGVAVSSGGSPALPSAAATSRMI